MVSLLPYLSLLFEAVKRSIQVQGERTQTPPLNGRCVKVNLEEEHMGWEIVLLPSATIPYSERVGCFSRAGF